MIPDNARVRIQNVSQGDFWIFGVWHLGALAVLGQGISRSEIGTKSIDPRAALRHSLGMNNATHRSTTLRHLTANGDDALSVYALGRGTYEMAIEADNSDAPIVVPARPKHNVYLESADFQTFSGGHVVR